MTCSEAQELIEAIASGEAAPASFTLHLSECRDCARSLAVARRIEHALLAQAAPAAPPRFAQAVATAIRRQRWQYDQQVDRAFNITIAVGLLVVVAGVVSLFNATAIAQMLLVAVDTLAQVAQQPPPWGETRTMPMAAITTAVVATAIGLWWWAERRSDFQDGDRA